MMVSPCANTQHESNTDSVTVTATFRVPKSACTQNEPQMSPKRRRIHHRQPQDSSAEPPLQHLQRAAATGDIGQVGCILSPNSWPDHAAHPAQQQTYVRQRYNFDQPGIAVDDAWLQHDRHA